MNNDSLSGIRAEVNPVFLTARTCVDVVADTGDEDSIKLLELLGFERGKTKISNTSLTPEQVEAFSKVLPTFNSQLEQRFFVTNNMIEKMGAQTVVDLPCGYTARGIKLARTGIKYYGFDLPAVIDELAPAVEKLIGKNENIVYEAVDATSYSSLRNGLDDVKSELFITTEGLMMYFSQSEIETLFSNIRRLLLEFGGKWVTCDRTLIDNADRVTKAVLGENDEEALKVISIANKAFGSLSDAKQRDNEIYAEDIRDAHEFISRMGFDLEEVTAAEYMPEVIHSLKGLPDDRVEAVMNALGKQVFWIMTPRKDDTVTFREESGDFKVSARFEGTRFIAGLSGRADTITSPALLESFRQAQQKANITDIIIDASELEYVSSAGLRVFLIMKKAIGGGSFKLTNQNETVKEILETTGFDSILE